MDRPFAEQLLLERRRFAIATNGVIAAPLAGAVYWLALAILASYVSTNIWCLIAFLGSGLIFPLALALQKPTRSNMMVKGLPLVSVGGYAYVNIALGWAITIPAFHTDPELVPLALGISMCLHLTATAWAMDLKSYFFHPILRGLVVTALWYLLPEHRFTAIPFAIATLYLLTVPCVLAEIAKHKKSLP